MSLNSTEKHSLDMALNALQERVQNALRVHRLNEAQIDPAAGDDVIADVFEDDAVAQYLHQHAEWQAVQVARERLDAGLSDVCIDCEAPIPFARLQVEPTAVRCIACQHAIELKNTRTHGGSHERL
jgi:DnaK suppressor protein